jgi:hypothetical protein
MKCCPFSSLYLKNVGDWKEEEMSSSVRRLLSSPPDRKINDGKIQKRIPLQSISSHLFGNTNCTLALWEGNC